MLTSNDLQAIDKIVATRIKKDVPPIIEKKLKPIIKRFDDVDKFLDKDLAHTLRRVKTIEHHLGLPTPSAI